MNINTFVLVSALFLVGACSTDISARKPLDEGLQKTLEITEVSVDTQKGIYPSSKLVSALRSAVIEELSTKITRGRFARLEIKITHIKIIRSEKRALTGMLLGANKLNVTAVIKNQKDSKRLAEYSVNGSYNPGGFGVFTDPETSTAKSVAEALVREIYKGRN
ncbi:MAG: hypothetical protein HOB79_22320 [Rhodospirillaceae bacterium]|jgi:hypothetical protein|nr:hypothetical protein [Rhodospirillales bacterium]MBT3906568.1 hypothetical protein [Rhodospirillaceae bacterium]MBT4703818.1 hypothetical protein [Rhodospirillaceae bacterium]MBT5033168.1 hypothetical protein [Rhodospirillaceae bacterium]MBT6219061.1 hypothetical protein [Rhodospirillaceae bacterium]